MTTPAKIGVSLSTRAILFDWGSMDDIIEAAQIAENSGWFDGVWFGDNFLSKPRLEIVVGLSAIAAQTKRVKLGSICLATFPMRNPIQFAIQWASLDVLSHGRTILTVCNGGSALDGQKFADELDVMGVKSNERVGRLVEGVQILRRLWSEDEVTFEGKHYNFSNVTALPKPAQKPCPIWIAFNPKEGSGTEARIIDRGLRRVGKYADGWQTDGTPPARFKERFDIIRDYATQEGRDPSKIESCLHMMVNINNDRDAAIKEASTFLAKYYGAGTISKEQLDIWLAVGSPELVAERIQSFIDAGCTTPVLRFTAMDLKGQLRRCIEEVLPLVPGAQRVQ